MRKPGKGTRKMRKDLAILGALTQQIEMSLFTITDTTGLWPHSAKSSLERLVADGWVTSRVEPGEWPRRTLYRLSYRSVQQAYLDHTNLVQDLMLDREGKR